jgi:hypothetical protein
VFFFDFAASSDRGILVVNEGLDESGAAFPVKFDIKHVLPHLSRSGLAEFDLVLDGGFQTLNVVEDHWESHQTSGDSNRGDHDAAESNGSK